MTCTKALSTSSSAKAAAASRCCSACLGIGYGRAARLIDFMAEDGIVGPYNGSQAREVVISLADWQQLQGGGTAEDEVAEETAPKKKKRSNKIVPTKTWDDADPEPSAVEAEQDDDEIDDEIDDEAPEEPSRRVRRPSVKARIGKKPKAAGPPVEVEETDPVEEEVVDEYDDDDYEVEEYEYDEEAAEGADEGEYDDDVEDYEEGEEEYDEEEEEYETQA